MHLLMNHFSDLHFYNETDYDKMKELKEKLLISTAKYTFFTGDLLNSNDVSTKKLEYLLKWLEELSANTTLFIIKGNHDIMDRNNSNTKWQFSFNPSFWNELSSINNIYYLSKNTFYEDNYIYVSNVDLPFDYYENSIRKENLELLITNLKTNRPVLSNLPNDKLKIFLCHSPKYLSSKEVLSYLSEFDIFLSGHEHNGMLPNFLDKILPGNRGIVNTCFDIFPDNSRGIKTINYYDKTITIIINGGIVKIPLEYKLNALNFLYSMEFTRIDYDIDAKKIKVKKQY